MKRPTIQLVAVVLIIAVLNSCAFRSHYSSSDSSSDHSETTATAVNTTTDFYDSDKTLVRSEISYNNPCIIDSGIINKDAEYIFQKLYGDFAFYLGGTTEYKGYVNIKSNPESTSHYIYLKVAVENVVSFSYRINQTDYISDGSIEEYEKYSGITWIFATVTGIVDNMGEKYFLNTSDLIGEKIVFCNMMTFWYNLDGQQYKHCKMGAHKNYGYVPEPGKEVIVQFNRQGVNNSTPVDTIMIIDECKKWADRVEECIESGDLLTAEMISSIDANNSRDFCVEPFYGMISVFPSVDVNGSAINSQQDFQQSLLLLDEYFQEKEDLDFPWNRGYFGDLTPPEINDVLRNISIGFE